MWEEEGGIVTVHMDEEASCIRWTLQESKGGIVTVHMDEASCIRWTLGH